MSKLLVILLGPTGVGKTDLSIQLAKKFNTSIVSCDSRQMYKEMRIGTAVPERKYLDAVPHFFIQNISIHDNYNCWQYEKDALVCIEELFKENDVVLMTGGSMLYIDAICKGIDEMPSITSDIREKTTKLFEEKGLHEIQNLLKQHDPKTFSVIDIKNPKRVLHALEVFFMTGKPYSSFITNSVVDRGFEIIKIGLNRDREELYDRINCRVDLMLQDGLEDEVRKLYSFKHLNSLNTVGYKEFFGYIDGLYDREEAIRLVKRNSRHYAKKQLTWFKKDENTMWFHPDDSDEIISVLSKLIHKQ